MASRMVPIGRRMKISDRPMVPPSSERKLLPATTEEQVRSNGSIFEDPRRQRASRIAAIIASVINTPAMVVGPRISLTWLPK